MINEDIVIDRNLLEEECSSAPGFFDYWQTEEMNLKTDKENRESELGLHVRQMDEDAVRANFKIRGKITEGAVSDITKSDAVIKNLKRKQAFAESKRKAYEKKILMLDVLARLHGQGYFSKIESKKGIKELIIKDIRAKIAKEIEKSSSEPKVKKLSRKSKDA